eukprot:762692-Hanusia_phi.AAC.6
MSKDLLKYSSMQLKQDRRLRQPKEAKPVVVGGLPRDAQRRAHAHLSAATIASCSSLDDDEFDFVIVDEATQIPEVRGRGGAGGQVGGRREKGRKRRRIVGCLTRKCSLLVLSRC